MTTFMMDGPLPQSNPDPAAGQGTGSLRPALSAIEECLDAVVDRRNKADLGCDQECFAALRSELAKLHAKLRTHQGTSSLEDRSAGSASLPPELSNDVHRLRAEHPRVLGELDRLVRASEFMPDRPLEDAEVFFLRIRELIAVIQRRLAEEDRIFHRAMWHDTGGES